VLPPDGEASTTKCLPGDDTNNENQNVPDCTVYDGLPGVDGAAHDIDYQAETKVYAAHWKCTGDASKILRIQYAVTSRNSADRKTANANPSRYAAGGTHKDVNFDDFETNLVKTDSRHGHEMRFWSEVGSDINSLEGTAVFTTECASKACPHPVYVDSEKTKYGMGGLSNKKTASTGSTDGYEFHLRVWGVEVGGKSGYRDFVSDGIDITPTRPTVSRKRSALRETSDANNQNQAHDDHDRLGDADGGGDAGVNTGASSIKLKVDWNNLFKKAADGGALVSTPFADIQIGVGTTTTSPNIVGLTSVSDLLPSSSTDKGCGENMALVAARTFSAVHRS